MESEPQALVEQYRRMHAQYRAIGERLRAALGKRATESERTELFRRLQELRAKIEVIQQELSRRTGARTERVSARGLIAIGRGGA